MGKTIFIIEQIQKYRKCPALVSRNVKKNFGIEKTLLTENTASAQLRFWSLFWKALESILETFESII